MTKKVPQPAERYPQREPKKSRYAADVPNQTTSPEYHVPDSKLKLSPQTILFLQRTQGNRRVTQLLRPSSADTSRSAAKHSDPFAWLRRGTSTSTQVKEPVNNPHIQ